MRSLVAEDSPASRALLKRLLSEFGECTGAEDGLSALETFAQCLIDDQKHFDLVCIDLELPGINGLELLSRIRRIESERAENSTKVLIVTGTADETKVRKVSELGADGYILKPIDRKRLRKLLVEIGLLRPHREQPM